jgi:hypothetical protein
LKNGKSSGIDGVINEYIKYTIDDMLHIYVLLFNIILEFFNPLNTVFISSIVIGELSILSISGDRLFTSISMSMFPSSK